MVIKHFTFSLIRLSQDSRFVCSVPAKEKSRVESIEALWRNGGTHLTEGVKTRDCRVMNTAERPDLFNAAPLPERNSASRISVRRSYEGKFVEFIKLQDQNQRKNQKEEQQTNVTVLKLLLQTIIENFVSLKCFAHSSSVAQALLLSSYKGSAHCKNLNIS